MIERVIFRNLIKDKRLTSKEYEILEQLADSKDPEHCFDLRLEFGLQKDLEFSSQSDHNAYKGMRRKKSISSRKYRKIR